MVSTDLITRRRWAFWFSTAGQKADSLPWREGMTVADVVPDDLRARDDLRVLVNGSTSNLEARVSPRDHVDIALRPAGAESVGAALIQAAVSALVATGVSLIISLLARPKGPKKRKDDESDSSAWSGPSNTRVEGQPRQLVFGLTRVAPQLLDEFTRCANTPGQEYVWQLFSFGEGPLTDICGITADTVTPLLTDDTTNPIPVGAFVGDNRLETLREVEMHVRMGSNEQEPIPGFEELWTDYTVDQELKQTETSSTTNTTLNTSVDPSLVAYDADNSLPTAPVATAAQAVWTEHGVRFVMEVPADAYTIVVTFPGGLNRITNSSGLADAGFQMAIRYREVDAFGGPITLGGNRGNGWVYERPDQMFLSRNQRAFSREYSGDFYNPQGYTPATQGKALDCTGASQYAAIASPTLPASWAAATDLDAFTVEGWFRLSQLPVVNAGTTDLDRPLFEWSDGTSTNNRGFGLSIKSSTFVVGDGGSYYRWLPVGFAGTPNGLRIISEPTGGAALPHYTVDENPAGLNNWHHVAFTYEKDPEGSIRARFRLWFDNQLVAERIDTSSGNDHVQGCSSDPFEFGRSLRFSAGSTKFIKGLLDEFRVWDHAKDARDINALWNGGQGKFGTDTTGLICGFHYDTTSSPTTDYSTHTTPATLNGGASSGVTAGWVWTNPTGTLKRARFEVECLRLNVQSTANRVQDESRWLRLFGRVKAQLAYPNQPLVGLRRRASDSGAVTFLVKGLPVPVWDGLSVAHPAIAHRWESTNFRPPPGRNPAWIALFMVTNERCALSRDFGFGRVSLPDFYELAAYSDQLIYDGKGARQTIDEADTTQPIYDVRYNSVLFDGVLPGIEIFFRSGFQPPAHWKIGTFLGFENFPTSNGIQRDINVAAIDGMQIEEIEFSGGNWIVRVHYDATTYGLPWTDGQFASIPYTGGNLTGTVVGREPRFQFDHTYDTFSGAWEDLVQLLATCRSAPMKEGSVLRIRIERPRQPVGFINNANTLVAGDGEDSDEKTSSFELEYVGTLDRPTKYMIEFPDAEQNYRVRPARVPFPGTDPTAVAPDDIIENMTLQGVTRRSQVVRHGSFLLLVNRLITRQMRCTIGLDALGIDAGGVSTLSNDLVPWGKGGKVVSAASSTQIVLDRAITVPSSPTLYLRVRFNAAGQVDTGSGAGDYTEALAITNSAGTYPAGSTITVATGFSIMPEKGDLYVAFTADQEMKAQAVEIDLQPDLRRRVELVQYDERVYDVDDLEADVPVY